MSLVLKFYLSENESGKVSVGIEWVRLLQVQGNYPPCSGDSSGRTPVAGQLSPSDSGANVTKSGGLDS